MKTMMFILASLLSLQSNALTTEIRDGSVYEYNFPGCEPGSGSWAPQKMLISHQNCFNSGRKAQYRIAGNCNGYVDLELTCDNGQIADVNIVDCYCD